MKPSLYQETKTGLVNVTSSLDGNLQSKQRNSTICTRKKQKLLYEFNEQTNNIKVHTSFVTLDKSETHGDHNTFIKNVRNPQPKI